MGSGHGQLIIYRTNHLPRSQESKLSRKLYGYTDRSQHGRYTYKRPGILNQIPHIAPLGWRAVLVTMPQDAQAVIRILHQFQAQIYVRTIQLEQEDIRNLYGDASEKAQAQEDQ